MDWKTFIASMAGSLAWPTLVAYIFIRHKDQLIRLIHTLKTLRAGDVEFDFTKEVNELKEVEQVSPSNVDQEIFKKDIPAKYMIAEYWLLLENSLKSCASAHGIPMGHNILTTVNNLSENKILNNKERYLIMQLRQLRNKAVHSIDFHPDITSVIEYKDLVDKLIEKLK